MPISLKKSLSVGFLVLIFASSTLVLAGCGKKASEPIVEVAPTVAPTEAPTEAPTDTPTEVPATETPTVEVAATEVPATDEEATDEEVKETVEAEAPESPLMDPDSPLPAPESPLRSSAFDSPLVIEGTAQTGFGGIGGRVLNTTFDGTQLPYPNVPVRLASVFLEPQTNEKLFILSGAESPGTMTDDEGYFLFDELDPGEYVMMVGDVIGHHQIIAGLDEQALIYEIKTGEVINAGLLEVELP